MRTRCSDWCVRMFSRSAVGVVAFAVSSSSLSAQTTVTLVQPNSQVVYATLRGGSYANRNLQGLLATRSADNLEYNRRALLKFDTHHTIPPRSHVTSALLTVTVKNGSSDSSRIVGAYQVRTSWTETQVTWNQRRTGQRWIIAGGDMGSKIDQETVGNASGTRVTFDVTPLVKQAVSSALGTSRYTRIALVDLEGSTSASYREYDTPDEPNPALRPVLKVTYGPSSPTTGSPPPPTTSTGNPILRVLHWNTHHGGVGTDGKWDPNRLIKWVAKLKPDIVSLNEVERYTGWGNTDQPALLAKLMNQYTGKSWYYKFSTATGASKGNGNMVLSRFPFESTEVRLLSHNRSAVDVVIHVNGRLVHLTSTHLDADSTSDRLQQIGELTAWARSLAEQRIIAGDINAWPGSPENGMLKKTYYDSWAEAQSDGTAVAYAGNTAGNTRRSRIDYIYYSHGATALVLNESQVFDTRDSNGVMPSDHRPVLTTFTIR